MRLRWMLPALVCCLLLAGCSRQAEIRELERAYGRYLACQENGEEYADRFVQQIISPAGSNDAIICFITEVTLPLEEPQMVEMITPQTVF